MREKDKALLRSIIKIENELDTRVQYDRIGRYNKGEKIHHKQLEFHKCMHRNRWVFGGNRSGKTECGAVECVWWARGNHPYKKINGNTEGWVVSVSREVQRDVAQAKLLHYLSPRYIEDIVMQSGKKSSAMYGVIDYILVKNVFNGISKIAFKSQEQSREKFQGASLDYVWFDEEPPQDIYNECRMRIMDKRGYIWGTMTPLKGLTFIYNDIYLNANCDREIWHTFMDWNDNPYLDKQEIEAMTSSMSDMEIESRKYGHFVTNCGLVYSEFNESVHVIEPFDIPYDWQDNISIDPGLNNPLSCHFYAVDYDNNIYVIAEHYEAKKDIQYHAQAILRLADRYNWRRDNKGRLTALIDSAASQHTLASSKSVAELFYDMDILVNTKVNKELFAGIARVKALFKARPPKIFIFKNCVNLMRELKSYWWGDNDIPKKVDDHALDELRYYIMSKPTAHTAPKSKKTIIEKDKEKLYSKLKKSANKYSH